MSSWRTSLWLLLSTVLIPAVLSITVGILILVFYQKGRDVAFGVLVLCFAFFAVVGSLITVFLLRRTARIAKLQSEFIANMSHDLRTPLTSIRMFVETFAAGRIDDKEARDQCLNLLGHEVERMQRMIDRVLTFRRLDRVALIGLDLAAESLENVVARALTPFEVDKELAGRLEVIAEPKLPEVMIDLDMIIEAIGNLVANALKYSKGKVVVTSRYDGEAAAVSVRDQGPAIPKAEHKKIFERFYRVMGSGKQGSGLGLAIAKRAARAHGGSLEVKSSLGQGNVFTLRLPPSDAVVPMSKETTLP